MDYGDHIKKVLECVVQKLNINKWRYEKKILDKGQHFVSNIVPVELTDEDHGTHINMVVKISPHLPFLQTVIDEFYKREVYFYLKLRPIFEKHLEDSVKDFIPECYYADSIKNDTLLVLKDMTREGFRKGTNGMYFDEQHVLVTLQAIAKFHAFSMILKENISDLPEIETLRPILNNDLSYILTYQRFILRKYVPVFKGMQCEDDINRLYHYVTNSTDFPNVAVTEARGLTYIHGDLWKENILFKYDDMKPVQVCLVDYQITRLASPATEILNFIMNCTETSLRRRRYDFFISTYYKTLQQTLRSHGLKPDTLYSKEDFNHDLQLVYPTALSSMIFSFALWLGLENPESVVNEISLIPDLQHENLITFKNIINNLFLDFKAFGFSW